MSATYGGLRIDPEQGRYRVTYRLAETGVYATLISSVVVTAPSRREAIAKTNLGVDAEVMVWGPGDPEPVR